MARAERTGFNYTRLDVDFWSDLKVRKAKRKNSLAPYVYLRIVTFILKEGYYVKCDSDLCFLLSEDLGISEEMVMECMDILTSDDINLLDHDTYVSSGVLTSHGIQMQYNAQCDASKRKSKLRKTSPYSLVISSEETPISSEETPISSEEMPQRKEKKNKGKESKENSSCCSSSFEAAPTSGKEEKQQQSFVLNFFVRNWREPMREYFSEFLPWNNTGGRSWRDMSDEAREAAVMLWKQTPQQAPRFEQRFLDMWHQVIDMLMQDKAPHEVIWAALDDGLHWGKGNDGKYELSCHKCLYEYLERNERNFAKFIPIIHRHYGKSARLRYLVDDETPPINDTT